MRLLALSLLLAGCDGGIDYVEDTDPQDTQDTNEPDPCEVLEIRWDGPDYPVVGDEWTVLLYCDDALVMGALIIRVEPASMALQNENVITWVEAGTATLTVQKGSDIVETQVEVSP
jgi:hypothetical protein